MLLTLNRPEKRNSLHPDLIRDLVHKLSRTKRDKSVNAVVITGAGPSFCAGLDLNHLLGLEADGKIGYLQSAFMLFEQLYALPQPVIAAINGAAVAGGFDLAALCDLRLCAPTATFAQTEVLLGITPIIHPLYEIVGLGRAKELAFTGEAISADQAYRIGFVNQICPAGELLDRAMAMAETLASRPREALLETKRLSRELIDLDTKSALRHTLGIISERLRSEEHEQEIHKYVARLGHRSSPNR